MGSEQQSTTEGRQLEKVQQVVKLVEPDFNELAKIHKAVNFKREASFALQILRSNSYLASVAFSAPDSLRSAILNVAAVGLSLSPVHKLAYLVPRKKQICLDISYLGYIHLGIDCGSIKWAAAELVCENDTFQLRGLGQEPVHEFDPFGDRGSIKGGYCAAKTPDGDFLITTMPIAEIHGIRDRTDAYKAYMRDKSKLCPWVTDEPEMIKKTVIRRAHKSWPKTESSQRLAAAIDVSNTADPVDFGPERAVEDVADHQLPRIQELLKTIDRQEDQFIEHLVRVNKRDIKSLSDLTESEMNQAIVMLEGFVPKSKALTKGKNEKAI